MPRPKRPNGSFLIFSAQGSRTSVMKSFYLTDPVGNRARAVHVARDDRLPVLPIARRRLRTRQPPTSSFPTGSVRPVSIAVPCRRSGHRRQDTNTCVDASRARNSSVLSIGLRDTTERRILPIPPPRYPLNHILARRVEMRFRHDSLSCIASVSGRPDRDFESSSSDMHGTSCCCMNPLIEQEFVR